MTDPKSLLVRIEQRLKELGRTEREVSLAVSQSPDMIRDLRRRGFVPKSPRMERLAEELNVSREWLIGGDEAPSSATPAPSLQSPQVPFKPMELPRDVPVYGTTLGADIDIGEDGKGTVIESTQVLMGDVIDFVRRPPGLSHRRDIYALWTVGESMWPRFESGALIYVDPKRAAVIGDDVVIQLRNINNTEEDEIETGLLKQLVRRKANSITLEQFNPRSQFDLPMDRVATIHRVIPWREALGY